MLLHHEKNGQETQDTILIPSLKNSLSFEAIHESTQFLVSSCDVDDAMSGEYGSIVEGRMQIKREEEPLESICSSPLMNTHNRREVTSTLPAFWERIEYLLKEIGSMEGREGSGKGRIDGKEREGVGHRDSDSLNEMQQ
ncbi:hypothetical protein EVAR_79427_1 [Eumeta japonica]|uniref:Uncharacterized protein n=1 Tax=Eumeta variegata TaxID=151549 RepID=A0A4C1VFU0_EUMVA|nr:hypothetical protein EVAR_79427_1 [Eumeta japonica]